MSKESGLQKLLDKYFDGNEPSVYQLLKLKEEKPATHSQFVSELSQLTGVDLSKDIAEELLNDPEMRRQLDEAIQKSFRNES